MDTPQPSRAELAQLLQHLAREPSADDVRVRAAELAVRIALAEGDPATADVAEALVSDLPHGSDPHALGPLAHAAATARGARRAIALARRVGEQSPAALAHAVSCSPAHLVAGIEAHLAAGEIAMAMAMATIGRAQHPDHAGLVALQQRVRGVQPG